MHRTSHSLLVMSLAVYGIVASQTVKVGAWNDAGHRLIAYIAFELSSPEVRSAVGDALAEHERYERDFRDKMPSGIRTVSAETRARWAFGQAAVWPDIARDFTGDLKRRLHHPTWHYISLPVFLTPEDEEVLEEDDLPVNLSLTWKSGMHLRSLNAIQALARIQDALSKTSTSDEDRAIHLAWLFHLVGDLHQPLHAAALFSAAELEAGDQGGNRIHVRSAGRLHSSGMGRWT